MTAGPRNGATFWTVEAVGDEVICVIESQTLEGQPVNVTVSLDPYEAAMIGRTLIYAAGAAYLASPPRPAPQGMP